MADENLSSISINDRKENQVKGLAENSNSINFTKESSNLNFKKDTLIKSTKNLEEKC